MTDDMSAHAQEPSDEADGRVLQTALVVDAAVLAIVVARCPVQD